MVPLTRWRHWRVAFELGTSCAAGRVSRAAAATAAIGLCGGAALVAAIAAVCCR